MSHTACEREYGARGRVQCAIDWTRTLNHELACSCREYFRWKFSVIPFVYDQKVTGAGVQFVPQPVQ